MDQIRMGNLIRALRKQQNMTQLELAEKIGISDKAVSKWERGCGAPDISLLPALSEVLCADIEALIKGDLEENDMSNGNMKKLKFYVCPDCGNLIFTTDDADVSCCGRRSVPLRPHCADDNHRLNIETTDGEWYITSDHNMRREHYISFIAFLADDTVIIKKLYPEWGLETRLPYFRHGTLLWYCTEHGLFYRQI